MRKKNGARIIIGVLISVLFCSTFTIPAFSQEAGTIKLHINGLKTEQKGELIIAVYDNEDDWLKPEKAVFKKILPLEADTMIVIFEDIPYASTYAVQIIHDKNKNGKFDMRTFPWPKPKEGAGLSNNTFRMGPPKYEKAQFELNSAEKILQINMRY